MVEHAPMLDTTEFASLSLNESQQDWCIRPHSPSKRTGGAPDRRELDGASAAGGVLGRKISAGATLESQRDPTEVPAGVGALVGTLQDIQGRIDELQVPGVGCVESDLHGQAES